MKFLPLCLIWMNLKLSSTNHSRQTWLKQSKLVLKKLNQSKRTVLGLIKSSKCIRYNCQKKGKIQISMLNRLPLLKGRQKQRRSILCSKIKNRQRNCLILNQGLRRIFLILLSNWFRPWRINPYFQRRIFLWWHHWMNSWEIVSKKQKMRKYLKIKIISLFLWNYFSSR